MSLDRISKRLKEIAEALVTVRTGTIVSDRADLGKTQVVLDNDPSRTPVAAQGLNQSFPKGTRVHLLSFPVGGLMVVGSLGVDLAGLAIGAATVATPLTREQVGSSEKLWMRCTGGGGAGGGAVATGASQDSVGGGGQGGHYSESVHYVKDLAFPLSLIGGVGGAAVVGGTGGAGGTSSVTDANGVILCSADGGAGGSASTAGGVGTGAIGGRTSWTGVANFIASAGSPGGNGVVVTSQQPVPGFGGGGPWGGGGSLLGAVGNLQGQPGFGVGAGGSGSSRRQSQTALAGGAGQIGTAYVLMV
jgi:hypothetical protein